MSAQPDQELEKLLSEVRKTISDNDRFLKSLIYDSAGADDEQEEDVVEVEKEEEFEEL
ncbi:hypothetical protein [Pelotalea chapellei]|uniref:Uncharacterized protein n=1 Tax=Pelotalea chapellei TaxID=44671 RepID=A0ABS5U8J3_9BACT|nr:hypothetical protein [Pelotalea chapellei]MBT1072007.1 hypothetical protein [Pelotalea chapellei]